jgi:hypothetical protein
MMQLEEKTAPIGVPGYVGVVRPTGELMVRDVATGVERSMRDEEVTAKLLAIGKGERVMAKSPADQRELLKVHIRWGQLNQTGLAPVRDNDASDDDLAEIGQAQGEAYRDELLRQRGGSVSAELPFAALNSDEFGNATLTHEEQAAADAGEKQGRELADQLLARRGQR